VSHGAYLNSYIYRGLALSGNRGSAVLLHASSHEAGNLQFLGLACDGAGLSQFLVETARHTLRGALPVEFVGCSFKGARKAAFGFVAQGGDGGASDLVDVIDCTFEGNEFWLDAGIQPGSRIAVRDKVHSSIVLRRADQAGTFKAAWNARVQ
jgi:hypothetical protein